MLTNQSACHIDKSTLATTLVLKASSTHRDECVELEIRWVDEVARGTGHAIRVAVDHLDDAEVGIIKLDGVSNLLAFSTLIYGVDSL